MCVYVHSFVYIMSLNMKFCICIQLKKSSFFILFLYVWYTLHWHYWLKFVVPKMDEWKRDVLMRFYVYTKKKWGKNDEFARDEEFFRVYTHVNVRISLKWRPPTFTCKENKRPNRDLMTDNRHQIIYNKKYI